MTSERDEDMRSHQRLLMTQINEFLGKLSGSRNKSIAVTHFETAMMYSTRAIYSDDMGYGTDGVVR